MEMSLRNYTVIRKNKQFRYISSVYFGKIPGKDGRCHWTRNKVLYKSESTLQHFNLTMEYLFAHCFLRACSRNLILLICSLKIFGVCVSNVYVRLCIRYVYVRLYQLCLCKVYVPVLFVRCLCQIRLCQVYVSVIFMFISGVCVSFVCQVSVSDMFMSGVCVTHVCQVSVSVIFMSCVCRNRLQIGCRNKNMNKETRWVKLQITPSLSKELLILKRLGLLTNLDTGFSSHIFQSLETQALICRMSSFETIH
jgi:hypothetical protein